MDEKLSEAIRACLEDTYPKLGEAFWQEFIAIPEKDVAAWYHFGLGLYLRHNVLLAGSELYEQFTQQGIRHKDDMSSEVLRLWHRELNGKKE